MIFIWIALVILACVILAVVVPVALCSGSGTAGGGASPPARGSHDPGVRFAPVIW